MTLIDKAEALLPCPFCPEGKTVSTYFDHEQGDKWGYASCDACGARGPEVRTNYDRDDNALWRAEAIAAWNRRVALPVRWVGVKDFDVEIVRGNTGGNLSLYFNDHRVAGSKPWGGGTTIHSFRVQGDEVKSSGIFATIRNVQTVPADKDFLTTAALAPTDAAQAPAEDAHVKGETAGQMLERLGMDGAKWAAEFRTTALRLGYSDMDEGWLIGWFCNAIMAGYDRSAAQAREAALLEAWNVVWEAKTLLDAKNALHALIGEART